MTHLRIGIIGCGYAAEALHLPALKRLPDLEVVALADPDRTRLDHLADAWGISSRCTDPLALIADPTVDVLAICAPSDQHTSLALSGLQAGKHILVEKPLALTLGEADQLIAAAHTANRVLMTGHNLRWHPFVTRARSLIESGALGEIRQIKTVFNTPLLHRDPVPQWRQSTATGGGVLLDLAVHHLDLWRFLSGSEVESLDASIQLDRDIDTAARISAQLANGTHVESQFSHFSPDEHTILIEGTHGRIDLSLYRADGFTLRDPNGKQRLADALQRITDAFRLRASGGVMPESYRHQWLAFVQAIQTQSSPNLSDDRRALELALQARQFMPAPAPSVQSDLPKLAAMVIIPDEFETVRRTLSCLSEQAARADLEVVLVRVGCETSPVDEALLSRFHSWQVFDVPLDWTTSEAKSLAIQKAHAPIVVFTEDHAYPRPGWAEAIIKTHQGPYAGVGPQVANGNPQSLVSWADYVIGYAPWLVPTPSGEIADLPGHNSAYKREVLLAYGNKLSEMLNAETAMNADLRSKGHRLAIAGGATIDHLNIESAGHWLSTSLTAGRLFGGTRAADWSLAKRLIYAGGSPLIPLVRLMRIVRSMMQPGRPRYMIPTVVPVLLLGLLADALGQFMGYLAGPGSAAQKIKVMEFHRERHFKHKPQ